ncbi:hypothetical protein [Aliarcobacter butzleri]|uniref:hypothetical protein n=1 Tax=Aliarcobacter butzleri TaxID=28197 RepID=UPI00125FF3C3|nr:hypothetical protein [Aliarcobacter butzleri]
MNLPVYIESMKREDFYFKMLDITLIALYYRLIDRLKFPINQDITMEEIIKTTKEVLEELQIKKLLEDFIPPLSTTLKNIDEGKLVAYGTMLAKTHRIRS